MSNQGSNRVKILDIALYTGYSIGTISKALHNKYGIADKTRQKVLNACSELGYIANSQAGGLRSGKTKTIAIIISDISNPLFAIQIKISVAELEKQGYQTFVMGTEESSERENQAIISALGKNVDGILLCPTQKSSRGIELLWQFNVPFVLIGRHFDNLDTDYLVCNDEHGGYLAGRHLAELGHRRILVIMAEKQISSSSERLSGYLRAMEEHGISVDPEFILHSNASNENTEQLISSILARKLNFTAIFAFSDYIAWEAIYILGQHGIRVPEDVSIIGFDNIQSHMHFPPPLTTVHFPKTEIALSAIELLLNRIKGKNTECIHIVLDTYLVVRDTTSVPKIE